MDDIAYAVNLYFDGLSLRKTSKALSRFVSRSHTTAIRDWIDRKVQTTAIIIKKQKDCRIHNDETLIKVGSTEYVWLSWIAINRA
ncbi:MAG: hypothetical protein R2685_02515 [Candidatus Nitrosocosmicus sp.]|nr:hypothetical protein [Candidatus Nitrosocosmicus sp.]